MGYQQNYDEPSPKPKLSLLSLPNKAYNEQKPGLLTPPINNLASIPFNWEEAPGKPRPSCTDKSKTAKRCLDLPPRLLNEANKVNNMPSPTTVLDGPYLGTLDDHHQSLSRSRSFSSGKGRSFNKGGVLFGSSRWSSFRKNKIDKEVVYEGSVDFSSDGNVNKKVKITRIKRKSSFLVGFSSSSTSHLLTNIYEGFKQVVPWRNRHRK